MALLLEGSAGGVGAEAHIAPRREPNPIAPARRNAIHCYGVDFLSTKEVLELFKEFNPTEVEWLDDSSCNLIFESEDVPPLVLKRVAARHQRQEVKNGDPVWTVTKPLKLERPAARGKVSKAPLREYRLELRLASEADRKDPGHSGHRDSVYYNYVKEQQATQRQTDELRRMKKRQRQSRLPGEAAPAGDAAMQPPSGAASSSAAATYGGQAQADEPMPSLGGSAAAEATAAQAASASALQEAGGGGGAGAAAAAPPRFGFRGLLDPLLFMRASTPGTAAADGESSGVTAPESQRKCEDLREALRRAEAEYVSTLPPMGLTPPPDPRAEAAGSGRRGRRQQQARGRTGATSAAGPAGRRRERTPTVVTSRKGGGPASSSPATTVPGTTPAEQEVGQQQLLQEQPEPQQSLDKDPQQLQARQQQQQRETRGSKRRPVDQEPRPVSTSGPPPRRVQALAEIEAFLTKQRLRCQRIKLNESIRSIIFTAQTRRKKIEAESAGKITQPVSKADKQLPPWDQYMKVNSHFIRNGQFMHTVAWIAEGGRRVLTVVPHPKRVDLARVARALQKPRDSLQRRKLKDISQETGFPVFVCPPVAHPRDSQGREPILLVDSSVTELKKPMLFDCGTVGLSMPVSEFFRCTGAACIEGLAIDPELAMALQPASTQASPEPAPEPAPQPEPPRQSPCSTGSDAAAAMDVSMASAA